MAPVSACMRTFTYTPALWKSWRYFNGFFAKLLFWQKVNREGVHYLRKYEHNNTGYTKTANRAQTVNKQPRGWNASPFSLPACVHGRRPPPAALRSHTGRLGSQPALARLRPQVEANAEHRQAPRLALDLWKVTRRRFWAPALLTQDVFMERSSELTPSAPSGWESRAQPELTGGYYWETGLAIRRKRLWCSCSHSKRWDIYSSYTGIKTSGVD